MTKRRIVLILLLCFLIGGLTSLTLFQTRSFAGDSGRSEKMSDAQSRREFEKRKRELDLERRKRRQESKKEFEQKMRESAKEGRGPLISKEQRREQIAERSRNFFNEKLALGATEEQWELIKAKLEKVRRLRRLTYSSFVGVSIAGGPNDNGKRATPPHFEWDVSWKNKPRKEVTEAQWLARQIVGLLQRESTTPEALKIKINALREARKKEAKIKEQWAESKRELRELLTPRQEAVLVLMSWL